MSVTLCFMKDNSQIVCSPRWLSSNLQLGLRSICLECNSPNSGYFIPPCSPFWWCVCQHLTHFHFFFLRWNCSVKDQLLKSDVWRWVFRWGSRLNASGSATDVWTFSEVAVLVHPLLLTYTCNFSSYSSNNWIFELWQNKIFACIPMCCRRLLWKIASSPKSGPNASGFPGCSY